MALTKQNATESIAAGTVTRGLLNTTTAGSAIVAKLIAGQDVTISSTGADIGTGDVTVNVVQGFIPSLSNSSVAAETVVARFALPSNYLLAGGNLGMRLSGQVSSTATLTFKIRLGTTGTISDPMLAAFNATTAGAINTYSFTDMIVSCLTIGTTGTATAGGIVWLGANGVSQVTAANVAGAVNTTVANFLTITLIQSVAQTFTSRAATLTRLN